MKEAFLIMGIRYCMHCGMPVPQKAVFCPKCGAPMKIRAPHKSRQKAAQRSKSSPAKTALYLAAGLTGAVCAAAFFILHGGEKIEQAKSRHRENMLNAERNTTEPPSEFSIPDISLPEISLPEIHLPQPPAAAFSLESYAVGSNPAGETVLYVDISYTNKAEDEKCFLTNFKISVRQDGTACRQTAGKPAAENHLTDHVQPDETALISEAFLIQADREATVSVTAFLGEDNYLEETILPHADGTVSAGIGN